MNCEPNDLAIVVRGKSAEGKSLIGSVVRVTQLWEGPEKPFWEYSGARLRTLLGEVLALEDAMLQPIRGTIKSQDSKQSVKERT